MKTTENALAAILEESLYAVSANGEDITPRFFDRFFALHPDQRANFFHPDSTCGAMVNEILQSLLGLATQESWVPTSIQSLVIAHRSYGNIPLVLYDEALDLLVETLALAAGKRWTTQYDAAWRTTVRSCKEMIARAH
ncbi:MAG: globin [Sphingomonadales bacterium]|nr:globin [Sphingomonadales bacterium]